MSSYHGWRHRHKGFGGTDPMYGPWTEPTLLNGADQAPTGKKRFAVRQGPSGPEFKGCLDLSGCTSPVVVCTLDLMFLPQDDTDSDLFSTIITDDAGATYTIAMVEIDFGTGDVTVTWPPS